MNTTMRAHKCETELREIAEGIANRDIVVLVTDENGRHETTMKPTAKQKKVAFCIAYGALLGVNWGESTRSNKTSEQAIIDTAEFQYDVMVETVTPKGHEVNGYLAMYCPLQKALKEWRETA